MTEGVIRIVRVLHVNVNYAHRRMHSMLVDALSCQEDMEQRVFVPVTKPALVGRNAIVRPGVSHVYSPHLRPWHRVFFGAKTRANLRAVMQIIGTQSLADHDVVHAHTLFSDGAIAHRIHQETGLPYVVTIRNTDVNFFWRLAPHLRALGRRIASEASCLVYLGRAYQNYFESRLFPYGEPKSVAIVPNGIHSEWLHPPAKPREPVRDEARLLFVGTFDRNKNIGNVLRAHELLRKSGMQSTVRLVGASPRGIPRFLQRRIRNAGDTIALHGFTKTRSQLAEHFRWANVFVMPSFTESFGLVYAEALSSGVPVICSRGQGFDGWFPEGRCGYAVDPKDVSAIAERCRALIANADPAACIAAAKAFDWHDIAAAWRQIYGDASAARSARRHAAG